MTTTTFLARALTGALAIGLLAFSPRPLAAQRAVASAARDTSAAGRLIAVKMVGDGETFRFEPSLIRARRGDVIRFIHTGEMLHNVRFVQVPDGVKLAEDEESPFLPEDGRNRLDLKLDARFHDGHYVFICVPHEPWSMKAELIIAP